MKARLQKFWCGEGGARKILAIALPLILSSSSFTIMQFVDRKFLLIHSANAFQAAAPAGMMSFMFLSLFFGTCTYVNTFVAQYFGAKKNHRIGASLWQGFYFTLMVWPFLAMLALFAKPIFELAGHSPDIQLLEVKYFKILIIGSGFPLLNLVLSSFYSGRGKTWTVMWVRVIALLLNVPLDYCMIFGKFGFPEMGIAGAAYATVISTAVTTILFSVLIFSSKNRKRFSTVSQYRFDKRLFIRLMKFGLPSGVRFLIDIFAFTVFLMMIGRIGDIELAATNATWSLNMIAFMPMIGFVVAISTIVGQEIGRSRIHVAKEATINSFLMVFTYMSTIAICFVVIPDPFLWLLLSGGTPEVVAQIHDMSIVFLRFVAIYSFFDAIGMVFSSAIRGAGDTQFVMWVSLGISSVVLTIPSYLFSTVWKMPATTLWSFAAAYIIIISVIFFIRYRQGHWEKMRVIEYN